LKKNHAEKQKGKRNNRIEYARLEGKRNWRVLGGESKVLVEGKMEKGEEEDERAAEEDVANVSIIIMDQIVLSSQTEQTKTKQNQESNSFSQLFILFLNTPKYVHTTK